MWTSTGPARTDAGYTGTNRCIAHPVHSGNEIQ